MARFEIQGHGRESGRPRKRVYSAFNEAEAREIAEADGTIVDNVRLLQEEPPTDAQLAYAKDLGILVPENTNKFEISDLISSHLEKDKPSTERHRSYASLYRVQSTRYIGKRALFDRIHTCLKELGREKELVSWFAFRIYRELVKGSEDVPIKGPDDPIIQEIADQLESDESVVKSIRRYEGCDLIWFGEWTTPDGRVFTGGSNNTIAYKRTSQLLRQKLENSGKCLHTNASKAKKSVRLNRNPTSSKEKSSLISIIMILTIIAVLIVFLIWLLNK